MKMDEQQHSKVSISFFILPAQKIMFITRVILMLAVARNTSTFRTFYKCAVFQKQAVKCAAGSRGFTTFSLFFRPPRKKCSALGLCSLNLCSAKTLWSRRGSSPRVLCSVREIFQASANTRLLFLPFFQQVSLAVTRESVWSGRWIRFSASGVLLFTRPRNKEQKRFS